MAFLVLLGALFVLSLSAVLAVLPFSGPTRPAYGPEREV